MPSDVVDGADVRMGERRDGSRFTLKSGAGGGVSRRVRREHFHSDRATQARVAGPINLTL